MLVVPSSGEGERGCESSFGDVSGGSGMGRMKRMEVFDKRLNERDHLMADSRKDVCSSRKNELEKALYFLLPLF